MKRVITVVLLLILTGCAGLNKTGGSVEKRTDPIEEQVSDGTAKPIEEKAPATLTDKVANQTFSPVNEISLPSYGIKDTKKISPVTEESISSEKLFMEKKPVTINIDGMTIPDFIIHTIGETLKINFFMEEEIRKIKTPVTLRMTKPISAERALEISLDILRQNGLAVEEKNGSLYIVKSKEKKREPLNVKFGRDVTPGPEKIVQIVTLNHIKPGELITLIDNLYHKKEISVSSYPKEAAILLKGSASSVYEVLSFIDLMDVPYLKEKKMLMFKLIYWRPAEFVSELKKVLKGLGYTVANSSNEPGILFITVKYLNYILVIAPDYQTREVIIDWKNRLDTPEAAGEKEKTFTYYPKYTIASDLVESLMYVYGLKPQEYSKSSGSKNEDKESVKEIKKEITTEKQKISAASSSDLKVAADDRRNAVLVLTTPDKYRDIIGLLNEIDTPPRQVLIEATIAEVILDDELKLGFAWYLRDHEISNFTSSSEASSLGSATATGITMDSALGFTYSFLEEGGKLRMMLNTLATEDRVKIISRPRLMILDNQSAYIQLGEDVPTQNNSTSTSALNTSGDSTVTSTTTSVQYTTTGIILQIAPTINAQGLLTMEISWEESSAQTTTSSNIDSPTIIKTSINTSIVAYDGQTIVLGGIMKESNENSVNKVPLLGDIPLLGYAFKSDTKRVRKTELIVLITPKILTNIDDTTAVTNEIKKELRNF